MGRPAAPVDPIHLRRLAAEMSDREIGERMGFARVTITAARKRHGIPSFSETTGLKRTHSGSYPGGRFREIVFRERCFADLQDEHSAYFLGLLAADGCVHSCRTKTEITLAEPDDHILHELVSWLDGEGLQVRPRRREDREKTFHRLTLCSKAMAADLISWGLKPAKTSDMQLERPIPAGLERHFMRGFWDGDGSIGCNHFEVGIRSLPFAKQIASMIYGMSGEKPSIQEKTLKSGRSFYVMTVASKRFHGFRQELYRDATVFLKRKQRCFADNWC